MVNHLFRLDTPLAILAKQALADRKPNNYTSRAFPYFGTSGDQHLVHAVQQDLQLSGGLPGNALTDIPSARGLRISVFVLYSGVNTSMPVTVLICQKSKYGRVCKRRSNAEADPDLRMGRADCSASTTSPRLRRAERLTRQATIATGSAVSAIQSSSTQRLIQPPTQTTSKTMAGLWWPVPCSVTLCCVEAVWRLCH